MHWIKAQNGRLVNLDHHTRVIVFGTELGAIPSNGGEPVTLSKFASKAEAESALNDLHDWLRGDAVGCDFSVKPDNAPSFVREDR